MTAIAITLISLRKLPVMKFTLPAEFEASEPPEARGLARDEVQLMVSNYKDDCVTHTQFREFDRFWNVGDVLVSNTNGTMNAAIVAKWADGTELELHLSTRLPAVLWSVEVRWPSGNATVPFYDAKPGEILELPDGGKVVLHTPYNSVQRTAVDSPVRLWVASLDLPTPLGNCLSEHGFPIRYKYVSQSWPISYYQTTYAT